MGCRRASSTTRVRSVGGFRWDIHPLPVYGFLGREAMQWEKVVGMAGVVLIGCEEGVDGDFAKCGILADGNRA